MFSNNFDLLNSIVLQFSHATKRHCTTTWKIPHSVNSAHNLLLVVDGEMRFTCNGKEYMAVQGDLVYFKPGDLRWAVTNPNNLMKCYTIDFQYASLNYDNGQWINVNIDFPFPTISKINDHFLYRRLIDLFDEFINNWISGHDNRIFKCKAAFMEIVSLLFRYFKDKNINYGDINSVEKAINFITQSYNHPITLDEISASVGLSSSHFGHIFKRVTGQTPFDFLIKYRISRAKELLRLGYSITETSKRVGFNDVFYFSKCFKRLETKSPTMYIKRQGDDSVILSHKSS